MFDTLIKNMILSREQLNEIEDAKTRLKCAIEETDTINQELSKAVEYISGLDTVSLQTELPDSVLKGH